MLKFLFALALGVGCAAELRADVVISQEMAFSGVCDASAGAALNDDLFAAADDESNRIRIYSLSRGGAPLFELAVDRFLRVDAREPEADIEGAARVGEMVYWITSHARNQKGKFRGSRHRFFATKIISLDPPRLEPVGRAYDLLLQDFENAPELAEFDLDEASELAPKEKQALNIEGLAAAPDGSLLIGFRNPVPKKEALLVPLLNPAEITTNPRARARLGSPIRLNLDGRGVRDFVLNDGKYFIIAGSYNSKDRFELYQWDGTGEARVLHRWDKKAMNPEAILAFPNRPGLLVLSDESKGSDSRPCKDLSASSRRFRGALIHLGGNDR